MKWRLLVRPEAEQDFLSARDWYEQKKPGLGGEFLNELAAAMRELALHPTGPPLYFAEFRRVLLPRFPYKIFYQVIEDRVVVFRVLHAGRQHEPNLDKK